MDYLRIWPQLDPHQVDRRCLGNDINPLHAAGLRAGTYISSHQRLPPLSSSSISPPSLPPPSQPSPALRAWMIWNEAQRQERRNGEKRLNRTEREGDGRYRSQVNLSGFLNRLCVWQRWCGHTSAAGARTGGRDGVHLLLLHPYCTHSENTMRPHWQGSSVWSRMHMNLSIRTSEFFFLHHFLPVTDRLPSWSGASSVFCGRHKMSPILTNWWKKSNGARRGGVPGGLVCDRDPAFCQRCSNNSI